MFNEVNFTASVVQIEVIPLTEAYNVSNRLSTCLLRTTERTSVSKHCLIVPKP